MRLCLYSNQKKEHALRHRKFLMRDITTIFSKQTNLYLCKNARVSIDVKGKLFLRYAFLQVRASQMIKNHIQQAMQRYRGRPSKQFLVSRVLLPVSFASQSSYRCFYYLLRR